MGPTDVSNTSTLYDQGLRFHNVVATGIQTISARPTRLMSVQLNQSSIGSSFIIYNGLSTDGEVVCRVATVGGFNLLNKNRVFDVVLSGGLTVDAVGGTPDFTINYI